MSKRQGINAIKNTELKILCAQKILSRLPLPALCVIVSDRSNCLSIAMVMQSFLLYYARQDKYVEIQCTELRLV